jgi:nitrate/TMAO reductase-like tetraheme cytochrome c subunit
LLAEAEIVNSVKIPIPTFESVIAWLASTASHFVDVASEHWIEWDRHSSESCESCESYESMSKDFEGFDVVRAFGWLP